MLRHMLVGGRLRRARSPLRPSPLATYMSAVNIFLYSKFRFCNLRQLPGCMFICYCSDDIASLVSYIRSVFCASVSLTFV